ncbi:FG-GAP repeat protein, partial [Candidatus Sumerlaeota bacterium]|nr:FG-GAP repeat protein [Candidatus Sumerlaeota bacterium]
MKPRGDSLLPETTFVCRARMRAALLFVLIVGLAMFTGFGGGAQAVESGETTMSGGTAVSPDEMPAGLCDSIRRTREAERYAIQPAAKSESDAAEGVFEARNDAQGFLARFSPEGLTVLPAGESTASPWRWAMRLEGFGWAGDVRPVAAAQVESSSEKIEYRRGALTEWYTNDRRGVEQWFRIDSPPDAARPSLDERVQVDLTFDSDLTAKVHDDGKGLALQGDSGWTALRYGELRAWDANDRDLTARIELTRRGIAIVVDARNAAYPITIDPLVFTEKKVAASDAAVDDWFGYAVSVSGDTALVGAYGDDAGTSQSVGSAYIFARNQGGADNWGQMAKLTASDAAADDWFGYTVSLSGDTALVGAMLADSGTSLSVGAAYVFERNQGGADSWGQVAKVTASDAAANDYFGCAVSLSGDTALIGARGDDEGTSLGVGSAYIFERNQGGADNWGQVAKLAALDAAEFDDFGHAVSLSGDTALIGAYQDDDDGNASGSAYIFERNQGGVNNWGQVAKLTASDAAAEDSFGYSVSLSGDTALVGAYRNDDGGSTSGSAYIFGRNQGGADNWGQVAKLAASDAAADDYFGYSVSLWGDIALVGAYQDDDGGSASGSAYVFERNRGGASNWGEVAKITASDAAAGDRFGWAVSLSGDTVLIGAYDDDEGTSLSVGSAYFYDLADSSWLERRQVYPSSASAYDYFGVSVSLWGDTALVGVELDDDNGGDSGSAYIYERNEGGAENWGQVAKLTASDGAGGDRFGQAVALCGDTALVGAWRDNAGATSDVGSAYIFERNQGGEDVWGEVVKLTASDGAANDRFGCAVSISNDTALVGAYYDDDAGTNSGSAYVFERNQGGADSWGQVAKLVASDAAGDDWFGFAVSISGDTALVGAWYEDDEGSAAGAAYLFERNQGGADNWDQVVKLTAADGAADDWFGFAVSISGDTALIGAYGDDDGASAAGSAYIFERNQGGAENWGQVAKLKASDPGADDYFGCAVSLSDDMAVIGANYNDDDGSNSGSAYVFRRNEGGANGWDQVAKLTASNAATGDEFGRSVALSGHTVFIGALADDIGALEDAGSAYFFYLDYDIPTPDPMTWASPPAPLGATTVTMTATTASDPSGVEYFFDCVSGGGNDSGWQDSPIYTDTGLDDLTTYTYRVRARDKSAAQNLTGWSSTLAAMTPDATAPSPDPMTWASAPAAAGPTSVNMTATTATDPCGVEYYFECTGGGGHDSGWQDSPAYVDVGLSELVTYTYRVRARDKSPAQNTTAWSSALGAMTPDATTPTPDPMTWASVPAAAGPTSVAMTATTASDPSGVEYFFECTAGGGHDSGWQDSPIYV